MIDSSETRQSVYKLLEALEKRKTAFKWRYNDGMGIEGSVSINGETFRIAVMPPTWEESPAEFEYLVDIIIERFLNAVGKVLMNPPEHVRPKR